MSQTWNVDTIVPGTTTPDVDIQKILDAFNALRSCFSGATEPASADLVAYMLWHDTTAGVLRQRNSANTGWNVLVATQYGYIATAGSSIAYTLTPNPALTAYDTTMLIPAQFTIGPGANPTIEISGLAAKNVKFYDKFGTKRSIHRMAVPTGWVADLTYDGTDVIVMETARRGTFAGTDRAIFGYGSAGAPSALTNLVSNLGVVATDTVGVGTARFGLAAAGYGGDKAIFGYGYNGTTNQSMTNLVSNIGVVATDTTGVGQIRRGLAAAGYAGDRAIFGYGYTAGAVSMTNLVNNLGVVASDVTGVGTARYSLAAAGYGGDKAIFGYGFTTTSVSLTNLVSNLGVVASDTAGVGTARNGPAATAYGVGRCIFGYGQTNVPALTAITNLVSDLGVVASDTTGVGTARAVFAAASYGGDKGIFGYGNNGPLLSLTNKVSNTGVVASDTTGVGTAREQPAAAGFSLA